MIVFVNPDVCVVAKWYYVSMLLSVVLGFDCAICIKNHYFITKLLKVFK